MVLGSRHRLSREDRSSKGGVNALYNLENYKKDLC